MRIRTQLTGAKVSRVLKDDGVFLCVTFRPLYFAKQLLACGNVNWDVEVETMGGEANLPYQGFIMKLKKE